MCHNYFEGLVWVYKYYFEGCSNWHWKYEFECGPLLSSLFHYLNNNIQDVNKEFKLPKTQPCNHFTQLLCILPSESKDILPKQLHSFFNEQPKSYKLNTLFKRYYWECEPILPSFDINQIKKMLPPKYRKKDEGALVIKNT